MGTITFQISDLLFSWDDRKNRANFKKHQVQKRKDYIMKNKDKTFKSKQDIPEIPTGAELKPLHHRPAKDTRLPNEEVKIRIEKHILAWFRLKAQHQHCDINGFINEALRQFIIQKVGDPEIHAGGLNSAQRAEVQAIVHEILASEIESQHAEMN